KAVVHATYGDFLIASSIDTYVLRPGGRVTLTVRAVDYVGTPPASRRIEISVGRRQRNANWDSAEGVMVVQHAEVTTDAEGRATWTFTMPSGPGDYRIRASADANGRMVRDDSFVWVSGAFQSTTEDYG